MNALAIILAAAVSYGVGIVARKVIVTPIFRGRSQK